MQSKVDDTTFFTVLCIYSQPLTNMRWIPFTLETCTIHICQLVIQRCSSELKRSKMLLFLLASLLGLCQATTFEFLILEEWQAFKNTYNKTYTPEEEPFRREIFLENRHKIALHNIGYGDGGSSFRMNINRFADMLNHEFSVTVNGFNRTARIGGFVVPPRIKKITPSAFIRPLHTDIPDRMDWREHGAVTSVKFQGACGSCYAFSAAGALEGHWMRRTGILQDISAQNFLDCSEPYGNAGCKGGFVDGSFEYARDNPGVDAESSYPYEAQDKDCRFRRNEVAAHDTGFVQLDMGDEEAMQHAVATMGPVSAVLDAGQDSFQFYSGGIYYDSKCENAPEKMNHAVLVVGYGTEDFGRDYWLIKNSYGTSWGIAGYMKLARNTNNHCGIATSASYPLL